MSAQKNAQPTPFQCSFCKKSFGNRGALARHEPTCPSRKLKKFARAKPLNVTPAASSAQTSEKPTRKPSPEPRRGRSRKRSRRENRGSYSRKRYSDFKKWKTIQKYEAMKLEHGANTRDVFEKERNIPYSTFKKWRQKKDSIARDAMDANPKVGSQTQWFLGGKCGRWKKFCSLARRGWGERNHTMSWSSGDVDMDDEKSD